MTTAAAVMIVTVRCAGRRRKDGRLCDFLLARVEWTEFKGRIEFKCPKCHFVTVFE